MGLVGLQQVRQRRRAHLGRGDHLLVLAQLDELVVLRRHGLVVVVESEPG